MALKKTLVLVLCACSFLGCSACEQKDDVKAILALIERAALLAEQHKAAQIMDLCTEGFRAEPGGRDRKETRSALVYAFLHYGSFRIKYPKPWIEIASSGTEARVKVPFVVFREGALVPDLRGLSEDPERWLSRAGSVADPYHLDLWLVKSGGKWEVDGARLKGFRIFEEI